MNDALKHVLLQMLAEIEDLRAHQVVTGAVLPALPDLSTTNLATLKESVLEKNSYEYDKIRRSIEQL